MKGETMTYSDQIKATELIDNEVLSIHPDLVERGYFCDSCEDLVPAGRVTLGSPQRVNPGRVRLLTCPSCGETGELHPVTIYDTGVNGEDYVLAVARY